MCLPEIIYSAFITLRDRKGSLDVFVGLDTSRRATIDEAFLHYAVLKQEKFSSTAIVTFSGRITAVFGNEDIARCSR